MGEDKEEAVHLCYLALSQLPIARPPGDLPQSWSLGATAKGAQDLDLCKVRTADKGTASAGPASRGLGITK